MAHARLEWLRVACLGALLVSPWSCMRMGPSTFTPEDAAFSLSCIDGCGRGGAEKGIAIDVTYGERGKQIGFCCSHRAELLAQLQTVEDWWCDGLKVPPKRIGGVTVATTLSEASGNRGATLDTGEGYVSFNCDAWLPEIIAALKEDTCCE